MNWSWDSLHPRLDRAAKWMAVATSFSLVVSTALCSVTMILFLGFWIAAGCYREKLRLIRANPIALWSVALFMMFFVGILYSSASVAESLETLRKYRELLYIPLLLTAFNEPQWQRRGYYAFFIAVASMLLLSYAKLLGLLPLGPPEQEYTVFKNRIAHSILMAYLIYLSAQHFMHNSRWR